MKLSELYQEIINEHNNFPFFIGDSPDEYEKAVDSLIMKNISEGLITTHQIDKAVKHLLFYKGKVKVNYNNNQIFYQVEEFDKINDIIKLINNLGYFIGTFNCLMDNSDEWIVSKELPKLNNVKQLWLTIESKFDSKINTDDLKTIYHVSEKKYLDRIKKYGLVPKSKGKKSNHPDRIYVGTSEVNLSQIITQLKSINEETEYVLLTIDYKKAGEPNLYNDPNYLTYGYYIIDNISKDSIINIKNI